MDFSELTKKSNTSFNHHKNLLKKLAKGNTVRCEKCQCILTLDLNPPKLGQGVVKCPNGCTEIILDLS
ncbi:hypothetical protein CWB76_13100 [Pseudoalteromonas sp. S1609]|nr:hypothetical protein [Pseudoalteromonas sp. S1609]TMP69498.1 hypothetical protein CWB76_13100 [Pseudoalteromonas sp. S1609]